MSGDVTRSTGCGRYTKYRAPKEWRPRDPECISDISVVAAGFVSTDCLTMEFDSAYGSRHIHPDAVPHDDDPAR